jgi:HEAT repeat protein
VDNPQLAVPLLQERITSSSQQAIQSLIADLENEDFAVRESATKALAAIGTDALGPLRTAASQSESPEVRDRASRLLRSMKVRKDQLPGADLRAIRAVEVLERIGSAEAKALLAKWENECAGTLLGHESNAASSRLAQQRLSR